MWYGKKCEFPFKSQADITKAYTVLLVFYLRVLPASGRTAAGAYVLRARGEETFGRD